MGDLPVAPCHVDDEASSSADTFHLTFAPLLWEGREKLDFMERTLHKHLTDACRTSEVAVYLEGRMGIEEVGVSFLPAGTKFSSF